jgi:hypothetical protein
MKNIVVTIFLTVKIGISVLAQNIEITSQTTFHDATWGAYGALEDVSVTDNGGILYVFVKNNSTQPDSVIDFKITQGIINASLDGWRVWPPEMSAAGSGNNISTITAKSIQSPVAENNQITIEVWTKNGGYATQNFFCATPKIRLANVMPSQDMQTLYVYLRNDDLNNSLTVNELMINEKTFTAGSSTELSVVGGNYQVQPGKILILKLYASSPFNQCEPLAIRVKTTRSDNNVFYVGAGIRVVESEFFFGTWHSSGLDPNKLNTRIKNRRLRYTNIHGIGNFNNMDTAYQQFFIKNIREPNFGNPFNANNGIPEVQQQSNKPYIRFWTLDDEPDLNGKPINEQMEKNRVYWENDTNTPSYVNLAVQKKYSRYGWLPDVVSMDHYAAPDAPNIIPLTWTPIIGRKGEMKEALEYTEYLKFNTEPRRMYSWCQFQANTWGSDPKEQPRDYALNYQFWAHIAGGAKGIDFFVLQDKDENDIPEQYNEGLKVTRQASAIRNLILYGEYSNRVFFTSTPSQKISTRALVSEDAVVLIVMNDNFTFTPSGVLWDTAIDSVYYAIAFDMPQWLGVVYDGDIVPYRLLPDGSKVYDFQTEILSNNRIRITPNNVIYKESHVYVIGINDTIAPNAPTGLNIPKFVDDFNYTLSWKEPHDNFGTLGYIVKFNGATVDTIYAPVFSVENDSAFNCPTGLWEIFPFDNTWNIGAAASTDVNPQNPTIGGVAQIISQPQPYHGRWQDSLSFEIVATAEAVDYEWQASLDQINWVPFAQLANQTEVYSGVNSPLLIIHYADDRPNFQRYVRCIAKGFCLPHDTSVSVSYFLAPESVHEKNQLQAKIFPNPNDGKFELEIYNVDSGIELTIADVMGKEIRREIIPHNTSVIRHSINIENQPNSIYLLQLKTREAGRTMKLLKH